MADAAQLLVVGEPPPAAPKNTAMARINAAAKFAVSLSASL
jgi:hypothetical protein